MTLGIGPEHSQIGPGDLTLTITPSVIERLVEMTDIDLTLFDRAA
ncbi:hypothetical protein [Sinorhizobium fredii]|nr:hypothetical protein [Sinorhizobium fredii]AWI60769.1 hypothetical protein AB395_00005592 [Sinorhizobium fredii CCBAU 45436]